MPLKINEMTAEEILKRFDRSGADEVLASIAREFARLASEVIGLRAKLSAMEALSRVADRIVSAGEALTGDALPSVVVIEASQSLSGDDGFHQLEYDPSGVAFRWTGPHHHFTFEVFVSRVFGASVTLLFSRVYSGKSPEGLRCIVDGQEIDLAVTPVLKGFEARATLPPRPDGGATVLTFICSSVTSPAELEYVADDRKLGLAFLKLTVTAAAPPVLAHHGVADVQRNEPSQALVAAQQDEPESALASSAGEPAAKPLAARTRDRSTNLRGPGTPRALHDEPPRDVSPVVDDDNEQTGRLPSSAAD